MSEVYLQMLIMLIKSGTITIDDIKDKNYKTEVERRLNVH